ncbi:MAG: DUF2973 domain-containing protein [Cyanobacteria bacterium P01_A01_bin.45]
MLHLLYILAFTVLASIAVVNLIRNLVVFSCDGERNFSQSSVPLTNRGNEYRLPVRKQNIPHPELLDDAGNLIKEPLLVMRSINVEDARQKLDALYDSSSSTNSEKSEES